MMKQTKKMTKVNKKSSDKSKDKRLANLKPFKPGQSGNPKGHAKGQRNFITIYREALKTLATKNNMTETQLENEIVANGVLNARRGDHKFYKDLMDRLHGMPKQGIEITGNTEIDLTVKSKIDGAILDYLNNDRRDNKKE